VLTGWTTFAGQVTSATRTPAAAPRATLAASTALCGASAASTPPKVYQHVIWIWMENHSYSKVIGPAGSTAAANAPYTNGVIAKQCGLATNYHNITHPSLPNYLAAVSGTTGNVGSDCWPGKCPQSGPTIFRQVMNVGRQWRAYQENMPANCRTVDSYPYAARHNPPVYFPALHTACMRWDVTFGVGTAGNLREQLSTGEIARFSFITPNLCHDTHDCSVATGDAWLKTWIPRITASPAYRGGSTALFITWDEGEGGTSKACATNTTDVGCHVATLVLSRWTRPGTRSSTLFNHYSLLRTAESLLGLPPLRNAQTARSMRSAFHL
jgi:hypothetical protein